MLRTEWDAKRRKRAQHDEEWDTTCLRSIISFNQVRTQQLFSFFVTGLIKHRRTDILWRMSAAKSARLHKDLNALNLFQPLFSRSCGTDSRVFGGCSLPGLQVAKQLMVSYQEGDGQLTAWSMMKRPAEHRDCGKLGTTGASSWGCALMCTTNTYNKLCVVIWIIIYIYTYMYTCKYVYIYTYYMIVHVYIYIHTHTFVYIYTHTIIHTHTQTHTHYHILSQARHKGCPPARMKQKATFCSPWCDVWSYAHPPVELSCPWSRLDWRSWNGNFLCRWWTC